jgi:predicted Zn-ribbon and HTH transcriptional regulator
VAAPVEALVTVRRFILRCGPCRFCGHVWNSRKTAPPERCASCGARRWDKAGRAYVMKAGRLP